VLPEGSDTELEALMKAWRDERSFDPRHGM
jgi:hypothetical protein